MAELDVKLEDSQPRQRSTNFSMDEDRVLQEAFAKNHDYLTAAQSNEVTNKGKAKLWNEIAVAVSSVGLSQ